MQPVYVTLSSSGSSPWRLTNWHGNPPMSIGFAVTVASLSSTWQLDVMMVDPTNTYPSTVSTVFQASQVGGPAASSTNGIGAISTCPIAAWRLTNNSTGGAVHVAALQVGIG
ncbi:hypothetical protein [Bradyrhizobium sp. AUGA SZCCT0042]|uniref:hypothetical protein n=1 Tax=Bradyrhizobium sp. AUGA SZCCT0042 TaxID=2807651 RepID=UPI001BAAAFCB|nr:hypothetical protein [Bradyrhizobium sp. AUGA SZCCT0042]MBR1298552.1 hypothetical protein [Bradyrhizobium sp. AUGA SZCCT0042]